MIESKIGNILAIAIFLGAMLQKSEGLTCYYGGGGRDYQAVSCVGNENAFCSKQEVTYQGAITYSRKCESACTENVSGTNNGYYLIKTFCCTTDKCNFSSALSSNKLLLAFSILNVVFLAFF